MRRCLSCMREYYEESNACPVCGYSEKQRLADERRMPAAFPMENILGARFLVGRVLSMTEYSYLYLAWDMLLNRKVVIREYFPKQFADRKKGELSLTIKDPVSFEEGRENFIKEAQRLIRNQSIDEICHIYRHFPENGTQYQVMEWVDGITLQDHLGKRKIDAAEADALFAELGAVLGRMQQKKLIHANLSPDNIILTSAGQIKVMDFGAAKRDFARRHKKESLFHQGYFAPEHFEEEEPGFALDMYSLGALYYRMLLGKTPVVSGGTVKFPISSGKDAEERKKLLKYLLSPKKDLRLQSVDQMNQVWKALRREKSIL